MFTIITILSCFMADDGNKAVVDRSLEIRRLMFLIRGGDTQDLAQDKRIAAIKALGELRAAESSQLLAANVAVKDRDDDGMSRLRGYPAAKALVLIGSHCYPSVFSRFRQELTESEIRLFAAVALEIDGKAVAIFRFEHEYDEYLKRAEERAQKDFGQVTPESTSFTKNMRAAIEKMRSMNPDDPFLR